MIQPLSVALELAIKVPRLINLLLAWQGMEGGMMALCALQRPFIEMKWGLTGSENKFCDSAFIFFKAWLKWGGNLYDFNCIGS
ncbi:hypothetical protein [Aeromonas media]|uniref:Uncharacterized protein n=1 Tax=Aeromonas media TaxID=651 RepID=A0AAP6GEV3_AERME|nr:hypothetical protein [Aeromonas media]MDX7923868.1 hypothetical protein [Aeromonas media]